jgi:hypothetical protein
MQNFVARDEEVEYRRNIFCHPAHNEEVDGEQEDVDNGLCEVLLSAALAEKREEEQHFLRVRVDQRGNARDECATDDARVGIKHVRNTDRV